MKVIFLLYEVEITVIAVMIAALAVVFAYIHYKKHSLQRIDEPEQITEVNLKIEKLKRFAYIIIVPCIAVAIISMAYFTLYKPPLNEQEKVYKEWEKTFIINYGQFTEITTTVTNELEIISNNGNRKVARTQLESTKELLRRAPEKIDSIRCEIKRIPHGIDFEKRKKLAESVIFIDDYMNDMTVYLKYMTSAINEVEKCLYGHGDMKLLHEEIHNATRAIKYSDSKKDAGIFGILAVRGMFNQYADLTQTNIKTEEKTEEKTGERKQIQNNNPVQKSSTQENIVTPPISNVELAHREMKSHGVSANIIATSYGHSNKGFLAKTVEGKIYLLDKVNNSVIQVSPASAIQSIANYRGADKRVARLELTILNDSRNSDEANGVWSGTNHILPVLVEYNYSQGQHIPHMIKSGHGGSPASYGNYLYEAKNVDAVNMIVEEAVALK